MTEILTESFCERCGTRYTFESSAPRRSRVGRVRTFSKGVRNFVMSDESSFSEAMADARGEEEIAATAHQLDAFHKTFNFCLTCRQYTCGDCWNPTDGRCLTCSPLPGMEPVALVDMAPLAVPTNGHDEADHEPLWPSTDFTPDRLARAIGSGVALDAIDDDVPLDGGVDDELGVPEDDEIWQAGAAGIARLGGLGDDAPSADEVEAAAMAAAADEVGADEEMGEAVGATDVFEAASLAGAAEAAPEPAADVVGDAGAFEAGLDQGTGAQVIGMAPGQSLEDAIAAYEAAQLADEPTVIEAIEPDGSTLAAPAAADAVADAGGAPTEEHNRDGAAIAAAGLAAAALVHDEAASEPSAGIFATPTTGRGAAMRAAHEADAAADAARDAQAAAEPEPELELAPVVPEPEPVADATPAVEALPDVAAVESPPTPEADAEPTPEPVAAEAPPRVDVVPQPAWPTQAPAEPGPALPPPAPIPSAPAPAPWLMVAPEDASRPQAEPQWPQAPAWRATSARGDAPTTLAGRPLLPQAGTAAMWAASDREVLAATPASLQAAAAATTPQPCVQCGLSLSANARFCRRCGTRQG